MPAAFLLDLDGTLYTEAGAIPGAVDAVLRLRRRSVPFRFLTNTTSRSRAHLAQRLSTFGFEAQPEEILTPVAAALALLRERGHRRVAPFMAQAALEDLAELELTGGTSGTGTGAPSAVLIGDLGDGWSFRLLQEAFEYLLAGAELFALSRDRYWQRGGRLTLDAGPFVAGLEYAAGTNATVTGKPSAEFFRAAVGSLALPAGVPGRDIVMVGDDLWSDVEGAQRAGHQGWLVRTGKFREETLRSGVVVPERVLDSAADILQEES